MDLDRTPQEKLAKNLWNTLKLIFYIAKKRIGKSKLIVLDLNALLLKRGKIAITKLMLHHHSNYYSAFTCRSQDDVVSKTFVFPREYEFSCSNTPLFPKRNKSLRRNKEEEAKLMQKVLDILQRYDDAVASATSSASPMLPGFGPSPAARQLRVSDSPFLSKDADNEAKINGHYQVDKDAEAFINRFYKDLKNQKRIAALESPSPCHMLSR